MNIKTILITVLAVILLLQGCIPFPGSQVYKPSSAESPHFHNADRSIFPSDIRKDFNAYKGAKVHWIGIIRKQKIEKYNGQYVLNNGVRPVLLP